MSRFTVVFGDVHGESEKLLRLFTRVREKYGFNINYYSLGDLIDRGPDSKGVIDLCLKEMVKPLLGNHEQWLYELISYGIFDPRMIPSPISGYETCLSYGIDYEKFEEKDTKRFAEQFLNAIPESHKGFILSCERFRQLNVSDEKYILTHAGIKNSAVKNHREKSSIDILNSIPENSFIWPQPDKVFKKGELIGFSDLYVFKDSVQVFGHTIVPKPIVCDNYIALDTGCGTANPYKLSGIVLETMEVISV